MTTTAVKEDLDEEITCSLCLEHFTDPRLLPCGHYYCKDCVRQMAASGPSFNCPQCRRETVLPQSDPGLLPTASFVNRMKDMHAKVSTTAEQPPPYQPPTLPPYQPYQRPPYQPSYGVYNRCTVQNTVYNPYSQPTATAQAGYRYQHPKPPYQPQPVYNPQPVYRPPKPPVPYQPPPMRAMPRPAPMPMQQQSVLRVATGSGVLTINAQQGAGGQSTFIGLGNSAFRIG